MTHVIKEDIHWNYIAFLQLQGSGLVRHLSLWIPAQMCWAQAWKLASDVWTAEAKPNRQALPRSSNCVVRSFLHASAVVKTITLNQLNMLCTVAQEKARLNCYLSPICVMATTVVATEVPILAPTTIGITLETGAPAATRQTRIEGEVDDDCTNTLSELQT